MGLKLKLETKKQKIIALILAIVSVILCVAIVLVTVTSCSGGETTGGKTVKRVVKKKVIIVQEPETEEDEDQNTYYEVVDDDYDGPEEVVDIIELPEDYEEDDYFNSTSDESSNLEDTADNSSTEDSASEDTETDASSDDNSSDNSGDDNSSQEGPKYEVELEGKIDTPLSDKIALAFYHYKPGKWTAQFGDKYGKEGDILSCCSVSSIDDAKLCKEYGMGGWIVPHKGSSAFVDGTAELSQSWIDTITSTCEAYQAMGLWDVIEGFHFDEPLGYISGEQFRSMTKFLAENYPNKRIYPVFSSYELDGYSPSRTFDKIDYYYCGYITDAGYDSYGSLDIETMRNRFKQMSEQIGRKDVRLWVYPATFRYTQSTTEDYAISHLNMMYDLLKEFENPGGIHMYTWTTYGTQTGFSELTDPALDWNFTRLLDRILEISKELKTMKYTYKTTKN